MAESKEAQIAAAAGKTEPTAGDPDASYVGPDLSFTDGVEPSADEKTWHDEQNEAREEQAEAAEEAQKKAAEARRQEPADDGSANISAAQAIQNKAAEDEQKETKASKAKA